MTWRQRLAGLVAAGGALSSTGCGGTPCGNANPDPCICGRMPDNTEQCIAEKSCRGDGGVWNIISDAPNDAHGYVRGVCYIPDAGPHD